MKTYIFTSMRYIIAPLLFIILIFTAGSAAAQQTLSFEVSTDINSGKPLKVDLIWITDEGLIPLLSDLNAPEWFTQKQQWQTAYPNGLNISSFELAPRLMYYVEKVKLPPNIDNVKSVLMFTGYTNPAEQLPTELGFFNKLKIVFLSDHFEMTEEDE